MVQFGFLADESTLQSFKLEDNTILETAELKAGEKITRLNEEFERVALEDGSYSLVENFEIEVVNGEITAVKEVFIDAKLIDGTVVKVEGDALAEGAKVVVVTADAEIPAPDGVHELEDGTKIETKDGIIAKVEEIAADIEEGEAPEAPEVELPMADMGPADGEVVTLLKDLVLKLGEKIAELEGKVGAMSSEFNSFKKEPAAKKIADGKTEKFTKQNNEDNVDAKIAAIMSLKKIK
jgi:hypothetical protein